MKVMKESEDLKPIRVAGIVRESIVDGPGFRFTIFCQGCPHGCKGCHNEETHDFKGGNLCSGERLLEAIDESPIIQGVTFSGGEPICQAEAFYLLGKEIKKRNLDLLLFTGYTYEELEEMKKSNESVCNLLNIIDYMIDGKYKEELRDLTLLYRGSSNQRVIDMNSSRKEGRIIEIQLI